MLLTVQTTSCPGESLRVKTCRINDCVHHALGKRTCLHMCARDWYIVRTAWQTVLSNRFDRPTNFAIILQLPKPLEHSWKKIKCKEDQEAQVLLLIYLGEIIILYCCILLCRCSVMISVLSLTVDAYFMCVNKLLLAGATAHSAPAI